MITWFIFPNIFLLKESCLYYLGEAVYEKQTSFVNLERSFYYEKKNLEKIVEIYKDCYHYYYYYYFFASFV